jgi:hypothetical protein
MNKEQLKELVKQHFGLVDKTPVTSEKFGELYDENKAFKIVFPGDTLKVGDEVKVVTTDGQESLAPDGYHKLEDGTTIKTEGSSVVEIESAEGNKEEEMADENPGLAAKNEEEAASEKVGFAAKESISGVQGTTPQNPKTPKPLNVPLKTVRLFIHLPLSFLLKMRLNISLALAAPFAIVLLSIERSALASEKSLSRI